MTKKGEGKTARILKLAPMGINPGMTEIGSHTYEKSLHPDVGIRAVDGRMETSLPTDRHPSETGCEKTL